MTQVDDTELTAYWYVPLPGENWNCIVQLYDGMVSDVTSIVVFASNVPRNVAGSAVVVTVVPDIPSQLSETLRLGGYANCPFRARQSYTILHIKVVLRPAMTG